MSAAIFTVWHGCGSIGFMFRRMVIQLIASLPFAKAQAETPIPDDLRGQISEEAWNDAVKLYNSYKTGKKSELAQYALTNHPSCVSSFLATPIERGEPFDISARFSLQCSSCKSTKLRIWCIEETYEGEKYERDPHHVECVACHQKHLAFDSMIHGYEGALGLTDYKSPAEGDARPIALKPSEYCVDVIFTYNAEFNELSEIAKEGKVNVEDLFDWFHIVAVADDGTELRDINYECA